MRKFAIVLVCFVAFMSSAWAEEAPKPASAQATVFTPEQKTAAQLSINELKELLKAAEQQATTQPPPDKVANKKSESKTEKTIANVADKALDLAANVVASVVSKVETVAPKIWKIMVMQQYVKGVTTMIASWRIVLLMVIFMVATRKMWKLTEEQARQGYDHDNGPTVKFARDFFTAFIPMAVAFFSAIFSAYHTADALPYFINPEYYAVKDLLQMLLHPGTMP